MFPASIRRFAGAGLILGGIAATAAQAPVPGVTEALGCDEIERFLRTAKVVSQREIPVGVTVPRRALLDDGRLKHEAAIQTVEERKTVFQGARTSEINFRDSWQFNVAAYELAKMLRLNMVPPYVEREIDGRSASVSWWVNDATMERDRYKEKIQPPDLRRWTHEMYAVRVFHELIYDSDPNLTNLLITKDWRLWMIDFTRAFRWDTRVRSTKGFDTIDTRLLAALRQLSAPLVKKRLGRWLTDTEIDGLIARRDQIVRHFDAAIAKMGEAAVLYDLPRTSEPCGTGLQ